MDTSAPAGRAPRVGFAAAALAGLVVAAVGLGAAELLAGLRRTWRSPVFDVGDRVIDRVPRWAKDLAIDWFGTNDKRALLIGIGILLAIYAAVIGILAFRWRALAGIVGVAAFGVLGAWAALAARTEPPIDVAVPSLAGTAVAAIVLALLVRASALATSPAAAVPPPATPPSDTDELDVHDDSLGRDGDPLVEVPVAPQPMPRGADRRRFLALTGGAAAASALTLALGRRLAGRFDAAASRASVMLPRALLPLPQLDPAAQASVSGVSPFFTPNADFYRIDINLTVPSIAAEGWRLRVHGLVDRELELSYDELLQRTVVESDITLTCVSNEVGGKLLGTARWLGVRLDDLLAEAGIDLGADQVVGRSTDGYTCGFPVAALDGRDALVAVGMNGEPLPLEHGFPARLIVPGLYGYVSATKWLAEIELTRFDEFEQYWVKRGWDEQAPIKISSRIDTPRGLAKVSAGTVAIAGVAWAQPVGVSAVEVRIDDGPWTPAQLAAAVNGSTWRQWSLPWDAAAGRHAVTVRAIDENGAIQTEARAEPFPNGSSGWHQIVVLVD
jgi:DMSO/TMAO reductase YedYZ molybdopterin-dependent catalytic subunit